MNAPIRDAFDCSSRKPIRRHFVSGFPRARLSLSQEKSPGVEIDIRVARHVQSNPLSNMLLMCLEYLVGAVSQLLATHFSPLITSHPPCDVYRSTSPRRPLYGSIKLLYHIIAVPFLGGMTKLAE